MLILVYILFKDENDFINPLLQVGSGSAEKSTGSGSRSGGPKINGPDRIRMLNPEESLSLSEIVNIVVSLTFEILQSVGFKVTDVTFVHHLLVDLLRVQFDRVGAGRRVVALVAFHHLTLRLKLALEPRRII